MTVGVMAVGVMAVGVMAVGVMAVGVVAVGVVAVDVVVAKTITEMLKIVGNDDDNTAGVVLRWLWSMIDGDNDEDNAA